MLWACKILKTFFSIFETNFYIVLFPKLIELLYNFSLNFHEKLFNHLFFWAKKNYSAFIDRACKSSLLIIHSFVIVFCLHFVVQHFLTQIRGTNLNEYIGRSPILSKLVQYCTHNTLCQFHQHLKSTLFHKTLYYNRSFSVLTF
jgi:hypothetical protein